MFLDFLFYFPTDSAEYLDDLTLQEEHRCTKVLWGVLRMFTSEMNKKDNGYRKIFQEPKSQVLLSKQKSHLGNISKAQVNNFPSRNTDIDNCKYLLIRVSCVPVVPSLKWMVIATLCYYVLVALCEWGKASRYLFGWFLEQENRGQISSFSPYFNLWYFKRIIFNLQYYLPFV